MRFGTLQSVLGEPIETVFFVAKEVGFDGVELDWHKREQELDISSIRSYSEETGVQVPSVAAHFLNDGNIANPDSVDSAREAIQDGITLCNNLGAEVLLVPFFGRAEITDATEPLLIEQLRLLAPEAERVGVRLGIETARSGAQMKRVFEAVASPFVGSYWDMANGMSLGYDNLEEIAALGPHLVQVHAKEWSGPHIAQGPMQYPGLNQHPLGEGDVPLQATLAALKRANYDGWVVLETGDFGQPHESARLALETLKRTV